MMNAGELKMLKYNLVSGTGYYTDWSDYDGKEFKSVCSQHSHDFINPDGKTIEYIKKLIDYSKQTTPYEQQYHPNFL